MLADRVSRTFVHRVPAPDRLREVAHGPGYNLARRNDATLCNHPFGTFMTTPRLKTPPGACDCHTHIFESRFPSAKNARHIEPDALVPAYRKVQQALGLERVVIVQPQQYGRDNRCTLVIEHIGKFLDPVPPEHPGFQSLLKLVDNGRCWVKLSGAYMMSKSGPPLYADIGVLAKALVRYAPERLVWASNWPHPHAAERGNPQDVVLLDLMLDWAPEETIRNAILAANPATLYGFASAA